MFRLALCYVLYHRSISILLVCSLTLVIAFPIVTWRVVNLGEQSYTSRAQSTPLLIGRKYNGYQLVLNSLYFEGPRPPPIPRKIVKELRDKHCGLVIPISNRNSAQGFPLIGTVPEYFSHRKLELAEGDFPLLLGDCAIGSAVARQLHLKANDGLRTDISSFLNIAHEYPFKLTVSGVLKPTGSADDRAVFVDIKTAWTVEGLGHGHDNAVPDAAVSAPGQSGPSPKDIDAQVQAVLGKGIVEYREVTPENIKSFHFHGDENEFPLTAVIVVPETEKQATMLKGTLNTSDEIEAVVPEEIIGDLMKIVFNVKKIFDSYFAMTFLATLSFLAIVVLMSLRNRREEFAVMAKIGCASHTLVTLFAIQFAIILAVSGILSLVLSEAVIHAIRQYVL